MNPFGIRSRIVAVVMSLAVLLPDAQAIASALAAPPVAVLSSPVAQTPSAVEPKAASIGATRAVPTNTRAPAITGTLRVPNVLTLSRGTWSGVPTTYAYQWFRCTTRPTTAIATTPATCASIAGATATTYRLTAADENKFLVGRVKASNRSGIRYKFSVGTTLRILAQNIAPVNTVAPAITGTPNVSQFLTASNGTWSESPTNFAYQWFTCNGPVVAAASALPDGCGQVEVQVAYSQSILLNPDFLGKYLLVSVSASNGVGATRIYSASYGPVVSAPILVGSHSVTGNRAVGSILSVSGATWMSHPTPEYSYQWYRCAAPVEGAFVVPQNCSEIPGAANASYLQTVEDLGYFVTALTGATNTLGRSQALARNLSATGSLPILTSAPVISGLESVGSALEVNFGSWQAVPEPSIFANFYACNEPILNPTTVAPIGCELIPTVTSISVGSSHSCVVKTDGSVWCWGSNHFGQLGNGSTSSSAVPVKVLGLNSAREVSVGNAHSCVILADAKVTCWGRNGQGQLGDGTFRHKLTPTTVDSIDGAMSLDATSEHTCAVTTGGDVACWGENRNGQLGDWSEVNQPSPVLVEGLHNAISVSVGGQHTCAVTREGKVLCWGSDNYGQLGNASGYEFFYPAEVSDVDSAIQVDAGDENTCALLSDSTARCWGDNGYGALGNGTFDGSNVPTPVVGIDDASGITASSSHSCALLNDGSAKCWGYNDVGSLGDGSTISRSVPVHVLGLSNATEVSARSTNTCAIVKNGSVLCWGYLNGALGLRPEIMPELSPLANLTAEMVGKYLVVEVVAMNTSGVSAIWSASTGPIAP